MQLISLLRLRRAAPLALALVVGAGLNGCAVVTVAGAAASLAVTGVGLAADAAVGTVKITGRAIGAVADAVLPAPAD